MRGILKPCAPNTSNLNTDWKEFIWDNIEKNVYKPAIPHPKPRNFQLIQVAKKINSSFNVMYFYV